MIVFGVCISYLLLFHSSNLMSLMVSEYYPVVKNAIYIALLIPSVIIPLYMLLLRLKFKDRNKYLDIIPFLYFSSNAVLMSTIYASMIGMSAFNIYCPHDSLKWTKEEEAFYQNALEAMDPKLKPSTRKKNARDILIDEYGENIIRDDYLSTQDPFILEIFYVIMMTFIIFIIFLGIQYDMVKSNKGPFWCFDKLKKS